MDDRIFVLFTLLSCAYHLYGQENVTSANDVSINDVTYGSDDVTPGSDVTTAVSAVVKGNVSVNASGDDSEEELPEFWEYKLSLMVQAYAGIIIVILGLVGNTLVLLVYGQKSKINSTNIYLLNLAAADLTITLIGQLSRVFPRALTGFDTGSYHPVICKLWFFINHSAKTISGWTLVAVTIERTLVVYMPLKARTICTNQRAKIAIILINFLCMACYLHYFWTYGDVWETNGNETVKVAGCTIVQDNPDIIPYMTYVRPWQDFIIRSAAPFAALLICNCLIIGKLIQQAARRSKMTTGQSDQGGGSDMKSMTAMLLTVSFAHLIFISPMQIMYLVDKSDPFGWKMDERWKALVALRWSFAIDVYYLNHAINFLLYCISGKEFRNNLSDMFASWRICGPCCKGRLQDKALSVSNISTITTASKAPPGNGSSTTVNQQV